MVKTAKYKDLYEQAWGAPIDCNQQGDPPAYHISFKRLAVAVAAWQGSPDVNSFSSPRDACIRGNADADHEFPCDNMSDRGEPGPRPVLWRHIRTSIPMARTPAVRLATTTKAG